MLRALAGATVTLSCRRAPAPDAPPAAVAPPPPPGGIFPDGRWNPARTWVFAVGVLVWQSPEYEPFPAAGRQDAVLVARFRARGVPDDQIVFVTDQGATRDALVGALAAMVARTRPGDLVWFYYAGHGTRDAAGTMYFVPHDTRDDLAATAWSLPAVLATIEARHRGPVLLTADCCHSGAAVDAVRSPRATPCAALASSLSSEESTGTWAFTECLIAGLAGEVPSPTGALTLRALADFTITRMANEEEQLATFATSAGFPATLTLGASASAPRDPRIGAYVEARSEGVWYRARIVDVRDDAVRVHYGGYDPSLDEWVSPGDVRAYAPTSFAVGARVEAEWHGRWYPATVRDARLGIHHVHYDGFTDDWDEWVSSRRIRRPGERERRRARRG